MLSVVIGIILAIWLLSLLQTRFSYLQNMLKLAQEMSLMNCTGKAPVSNLRVRTLLNTIGSSRFCWFTPRCLPPKLLRSKTLQIILPYSSFHSKLHPNPFTTPLFQRVLMPYIKISRNLGKGSCHRWPWLMPLQMVTKSLCQRLCPLILLRKLSSIFLILCCRQQIQNIAFSGHIFFRYKCQSH